MFIVFSGIALKRVIKAKLYQWLFKFSIDDPLFSICSSSGIKVTWCYEVVQHPISVTMSKEREATNEHHWEQRGNLMND